MTINLSRSILLIAQFGLVNYQDAKSNIACSPEVTCQSNSAYFCDTFKDRKGIGTRFYHDTVLSLVQMKLFNWAVFCIIFPSNRWRVGGTLREQDGYNLVFYDGQWKIHTHSNPLLKRNYVLLMQTPAAYHAICSAFKKPFIFRSKPLIIQYDLKFQVPLMECGGGYVKLYEGFGLNCYEIFRNDTEFQLMFGPDKCGGKQIIHFIIGQKDHKTSVFTPQAISSKRPLNSIFQDTLTHLFTLALYPNDSYFIYIDQLLHDHGNLKDKMMKKMSHNDFPKDKSNTLKRAPTDWNNEEVDSVSPAVNVNNATCKDGSDCVALHEPSMRDLEHREQRVTPLTVNRKESRGTDESSGSVFRILGPIHWLGLELWTDTPDLAFDNFLVTDNLTFANYFAQCTWQVQQAAEKEWIQEHWHPTMKQVMQRYVIQRATWREIIIALVLLHQLIECALSYLTWDKHYEEKMAETIENMKESGAEDEPSNTGSFSLTESEEAVESSELSSSATEGVFPPGQTATIGVDFMIKTLMVGDDKVKLQIWDTAGQERFRSITQSYYRSAHAIILVYDVACQPTFDRLPEWITEIDQYANQKVLRILAGNKCDKEEEREIPERVGSEFAERNGGHGTFDSGNEGERCTVRILCYFPPLRYFVSCSTNTFVVTDRREREIAFALTLYCLELAPPPVAKESHRLPL
ncbi:hypothetical protein M513_13076, partial [Trichuris suis]